LLSHLRVKIKSLAAEAHIIRHEERRALATHRRRGDLTKPCEEHERLHEHRTGIVRRVARESLLAYGFLRGRTYRQMEARCSAPPNWAEVWKVACRFRFELTAADRARFDAWRQEPEPVKAVA
jgi:hypothetical protein